MLPSREELNTMKAQLDAEKARSERAKKEREDAEAFKKLKEELELAEVAVHRAFNGAKGAIREAIRQGKNYCYLHLYEGNEPTEVDKLAQATLVDMLKHPDYTITPTVHVYQYAYDEYNDGDFVETRYATERYIAVRIYWDAVGGESKE